MPRGLRTLLLVCATVTIAVVAATAAGARSQADPFKVMVMVGVNTVANNFPYAQDGAKVAADIVNKAGGLKGRPIEITLCNHQQTTDGGIACARKAVDEKFDNVISYNFSLSNVSQPILSGAGIPEIGAIVSTAAEINNKLAFPIGPATHATHAASIFYEARVLKLKRFAIMGGEAALAHPVANFVVAAIRRTGSQYLGQIWTPTLTVSDTAPYVQQLRSLNPEAVDIVFPASQMPSFTRTAQQFGLKAKWNSTLLSQQESDLANMANQGEGVVLGSPLPIYSTNTPGVKKFLSAMNAAGKNDSAIISSPATLWAYTAIMSLKELSKKVKGAVTKQSLVAAARAQKTPLDVAGIVKWAPGKRGPAAFPNQPNGVVFVYEAQNGKLVYKQTIDVWKEMGIARK